MKRYALVSIKNTSAETIDRYLPANYKIIGQVKRANPVDDSDYEFCFGPCVVVAGEDNSGWTLSEYVLPRLASGMHVGREIDLSHPVMKEIPEPTLYKFVVYSDCGERVWHAEDEEHAREQHVDAFPEEPIFGVSELIR